MSTLDIALLQMAACGTDIEANAHKGEEFCRKAAAMGAHVALFPEMWSNGYSFFGDEEGAREAWAAQAVPRDGAYVERFRALARELDMAIALTYLEEWQGGPRNSVSLIDRHGKVLFTYAKVHTCDFDKECALTPGDDFYVADLDTQAGPVKVGAMICYDREFPESARVLMLKGAEIILTPNACTVDEPRIAQFKTRAYENMVGVAMTNYAPPNPDANGHSMAFHPVAYGKDERARDTLVIEAGEAEGVYIARFDLEQIREWRRTETWGNAFRRPRAYSILTAPDVVEPFVRPQARK